MSGGSLTMGMDLAIWSLIVGMWCFALGKMHERRKWGRIEAIRRGIASGTLWPPMPKPLPPPPPPPLRKGSGERPSTPRPAIPGLLLALSIALPAAAQDEPIPSNLQYGYTALSWAQTLVKKGDDQKILFGARALGFVELNKWRLYGRADASATQDGGAAEGSVSFTNLSSFSDLELYGALAYEALPGWQVVAVYGLAIPIEAGKPNILVKYPKTLTLGVSKALNYGTGQGFVLVSYGRHDAGGGEHFDKLVGTLQLPVKAGVYVVGDVVVNLGQRGASFSRAGLAYKF